jgi:UDP-N-acetyl-D-galactosamine dehydrogenase
VYESTVYPGVTEDICGPILEAESGLIAGQDFFLGYSPERINPGDKVHTIDRITKVVAAQTPKVAQLLARLYGTINGNNIFTAKDIRTAEASKVIENAQRDINIAFVNEIAEIFGRMDLSVYDVLEAAGTKWNFLPFTPGLVGGHCIGVDPYYLTFKAEALGYHPEMILAGRRINDNMGKYVAERVVKMLISAGKQVRNARVAVLGLTFKEDVPDLRNTRVIDIITELADYGVQAVVHDPMASADEAHRYYGLELQPLEALRGVDAVVLAVLHRSYRELGLACVAGLCQNGKPMVIDVKGAFTPAEAQSLGIAYWRI